MKRNRPRKAPRRGTTPRGRPFILGEGELHRLRSTLRTAGPGRHCRPACRGPVLLGRRRERSQSRRRSKGASGVAPHAAHVRDAPQPASQPPDITSPRPAPRKPKLTRLPPLKPFEYWDFPSEAVVREPPPDVISDVDRARFEANLRAGLTPWNDAGEDLFVIIGLDFGTSSTKVIVRLPFEPGEPTIAIPAPAPCRSGDDPYLWQTVLWVQGDGAFLPWPEPGADVLGALKQGLIQGRAETATPASGALAVTRTHAGTAYLAFVVRYVKGWLRANRPDHFRGRRPVWFVNVGIPTASYDDVHIFKSYRRIAAAAASAREDRRPRHLGSRQVLLRGSPCGRCGQFRRGGRSPWSRGLPRSGRGR